jgi:hypothetical protein
MLIFIFIFSFRKVHLKDIYDMVREGALIAKIVIPYNNVDTNKDKHFSYLTKI